MFKSCTLPCWVIKITAIYYGLHVGKKLFLYWFYCILSLHTWISFCPFFLCALRCLKFVFKKINTVGVVQFNLLRIMFSATHIQNSSDGSADFLAYMLLTNAIAKKMIKDLLSHHMVYKVWKKNNRIVSPFFWILSRNCLQIFEIFDLGTTHSIRYSAGNVIVHNHWQNSMHVYCLLHIHHFSFPLPAQQLQWVIFS